MENEYAAIVFETVGRQGPSIPSVSKLLSAWPRCDFWYLETPNVHDLTRVALVCGQYHVVKNLLITTSKLPARPQHMEEVTSNKQN